jgi:hypothetical protein
MESGGEGTANARSTRSSGRLVGWTCILAPGETTRRAGNRLMLAAAVCELPYVAAKRRKVPTSRPSDRGCCPFAARGRVPDADGVGAGAFCLLMSHETPGDRGSRALPSPYRARAVVSPGVSCRGARSHAGWGASTGTEAGLWMTLGTSRAGMLTGAGRAVDNPVDGWGRPPEREFSLPARPAPKAARVLWTGKSWRPRVATRCDTPGDERIEGS